MALALGPAALLAAGAALPSPATARGRPYVAAYSALVRPAAMSKTPARLLRPSAPPTRRTTGPMRPDPDGLARFARQSNLPALPEGFDLADYDLLLVAIDALRFDRTSLAAPSLGTTPSMVALAERGAFTMTRAYSPSNGTYPSLVSLFSMTIPSFARHEIHAKHWHGRLHSEQPTAPEALGEAGFLTFWQGFNFKRVMTVRIHGLTERFERHHLELIWPERDLDADARIVDRAIREIRAARRADRRYFGLIFLSSPHDDYQIHDRERPAKRPRDRYDQEVRYADSQLGRLLQEVDRGGGLDRTVVVITADHGEAFREHGHSFHLSSLYDEQVHVPLLIWVPGLSGGRLAEPTSNLYVLPWLMLRGPAPARAAAERAIREELGPLMRETGGAVISEFISRQRQHATLRYSDYTVYYDLAADFFRVFDARRDPGEQHDLREERPDLVEALTPRVQAYRRARFAGQRYFFTDPPSEE